MAKGKKKDPKPSTNEEWADYLRSLNGSEAEAAEDILKQTDHSIDSAIMLLEDSKLLGQDAFDNLKKQGGQLKDIDNSLKQIQRDTEKSRKGLNVLKSIFGDMWNKITACFHPPIEDEDWPERREPNYHRKPGSKKTTAHDSSQASTPLFNSFKKSELELDKIGGLTSDLKDIALNIQNELKYQDKILDTVLDDADRALKEMRTLNKKAADMLP